jgi:hypothetical protein
MTPKAFFKATSRLVRPQRHSSKQLQDLYNPKGISKYLKDQLLTKFMMATFFKDSNALLIHFVPH